ncbi:MAG TPA: TonB-dependent receptor [Cyclobacteriaceae bacterium]
MIQSLLKKVLTMTRYAFYGLILQCTTMTVLLSYNGTMAQRKSLKEIHINMDAQHRAILDIFREIEEKTNLHFAYNNLNLSTVDSVTVDTENKDLATILGEIAGTTGLRFKRINDNVLVSLHGSSSILKAPDVTEQISKVITGKVTAIEDGNPMPGVNIVVKGSTTGTTTDSEGAYSIEVPDNNAVLVFSFIGYVTEEIVVGTQTAVNVSLVADITSLSEIVVVGYGTQKKSDLTGAVSLVDTKEMTKQAASDVTQMLQGRVAGVAITSDGQPGASPSVRIRGVSTFGIGSSAEPLYVVDGFPLAGGIRDINPNDIESIQVLKDASAGAIYGNRAANGVVIVTTKKGKNGKLTVGYNSYYGFQKVYKHIPLLNRAQYQTINNELLTNAGMPLVPGNDPSSPSYITNIDTDWQNAGYKKGSIQNQNLNFSGGSQNTNYFISLDYLNNIGTLVGSGPDYKRYSLRANTETHVGKFKVGENLMVMRSDENPLFYTTSINLPGGRPTLVNDLLQAAPTIPLYDPSREGGFGGADAVINNSITLNVPGINTLIKNSTKVDRVLANVYGEYEIIKGLKAKTNLQFDNTSIHDQLFVPKYDLGYFFPNTNARLTLGNRNSESFLIENTLNYAKEVGKHNVNVLVGQTYQEFDFRQVTTTASGLEKPYILSLASGSSFSVTDNHQPSKLSSLLGRVNYAYNDQYLLTVNLRRDGSSRFAKANRFGTFPSVGVAWKIHNTFTLPSVVSELKLRGGIGQLGNQEIGNFRYQSTINRSIPYEFASGRNLGAATTILVDPGIKWETRITRNIGVDAVFLNGKLDFTAEYYSNVSKNVLVDLPIPLTSGSLSGLTTNAGSLQNSGIELSLQYQETLGDFSFTIAPNFYTVKNKVLDIGPLDLISGAGARTVVGKPVGENYGWVYQGIFQNANQINTVAPTDAAFDATKHAFQTAQTAPGDVMFKDLNNDGKIDDTDRTFLGNGMPTYYYGLNITANYKGFDFTVFASGSGGNYINSNLYRGLMPTTGYTNWHKDILNHWTPEHTNTDIPRVVWNDPNGNGRDSNRPGWLQKGDYLRLNTVSLGYSLSPGFLSKIKVSSLRVYATLQNVYTMQKYKGYNPDFQAGILNPGFDYGTFPRPRTTMFGVQLKF